jgi:bifunctional DNA-binding transcriptional regulator/antitoxin component of YhaV-PrlF toxin-antitoxin module
MRSRPFGGEHGEHRTPTAPARGDPQAVRACHFEKSLALLPNLPYIPIMTLHANLTMAPNGRLVIPAAMRESLGFTNGGQLLARLEDGVLTLETVDAAVRRAQAIVRQYIPEGVSLVDELIAERRAAAENE